ncbi:Spore cortex-lytic enzyme precursor [compost metagenome]|uniref:cell wall hydrolase n=1 Tax=Pseudomonas sp. ACN8 TaxID=1920428 RepID=UPI000BB3D15F|nr:cell wall hydrolase [Pseudomonas sp. ACN8]PBJ25700.1 Spore cortex-lytic enzyme precursor [Pseudomonas sp. ACN8]
MTPGSALFCLALNIYHEARGEPKSGQIAVAMVTMNRAEWVPGKVCQVVYERGQFSWTDSKRNKTPREPQAWKKAQAVARGVIDGEHPDITQGATHFHAKRVRPLWTQRLEKTVRIGDHIFYTQR